MPGFLQRHVLHPLLRLLRHGVPPKRLAWSLAIAIVVGVKPLIGMTTLCMLLVASHFRLNYVATQIGIHLVAPLQWILFVPFVQAGILIFRAHRLPLSKRDIMHLSHKHPVQLVHILWRWEWHALIVWAIFAALLAPPLARQIRKGLVLYLRRHRTVLH